MTADGGDSRQEGLVEREAGPGRGGTFCEELLGIAGVRRVETLEPDPVFSLLVERTAAGGQDPEARRSGEESRCDPAGLLHHVFAVVQ